MHVDIVFCIASKIYNLILQKHIKQTKALAYLAQKNTLHSIALMN